MPRPGTRSRPIARGAPAIAAQPDQGDVEERQSRGRTRNSRSMGTGISNAAEKLILSANRKRDAALERLVNEDNTTTADDTSSPVEVGRHVDATPAQNRRDTTGLDLGDSMFGDLDDSFDDPAGGLSVDNSSITMSSFKPRSRQSSFIGRNDPPIRPSSRGGNTSGVSSTFNIGMFRRRAREPSILGTSRKPRPEINSTTVEADTRAVESSSEEEEEDFNPDAESTPLKNRRSTQPRRPSEEVGEPSQVLPEPRSSRKRKSDGAPEGSARSAKVLRIEQEDQPEGISSDSGSDSELSSVPTPQQLRSRPVTPTPQEDDDEIAAPPASSGSEGGEIWPDIHQLAKRRRRPSVHTPSRPAVDARSDVSSPPSLTHSPNFAQQKGPKTRGRQTRRQASPKLTTADLANMIPQRRSKRAENEMESDEELDAGALGQDEDELSYLDANSRRKKTNRSASRGTSRPGSRGGRAAPSAAKTRQAAAKSNRPTYARRASNKENESADDGDEQSGFLPLPDETFDESTGEVIQAEELRNATQKFKEVDRWELDYEEAIDSSSPPGAR